MWKRFRLSHNKPQMNTVKKERGRREEEGGVGWIDHDYLHWMSIQIHVAQHKAENPTRKHQRGIVVYGQLQVQLKFRFFNNMTPFHKPINKLYTYDTIKRKF